MNPRLALLLLFPVLAISLQAAPTLFDSDDVLELRLIAPITELKKQRGNEPEWIDATLESAPNSESPTVYDIKVKARGNLRRQKDICAFPSFWLNFKKKQVDGTEFHDLDKVKVVAHCRGWKNSFDPYIHKEFLAYKTLNLITDKSFRVRLARIEYVDTTNNAKPSFHPAFLIEPVKNLEERLNVTHVEDRHILPTRYDPMDRCTAEIFQYFIGNTDFTFYSGIDECCHNAKAFQRADGSLFPVPYDFDLSGIVDTPYSGVDPAFDITNVTQRLYRGVEVSTEVMEETIRHYLDKRDEIYALWQDTELLPPGHQKKALRFIDQFYATLENERRVRLQIILKLRDIEILEDIVLESMQKAAKQN